MGELKFAWGAYPALHSHHSSVYDVMGPFGVRQSTSYLEIPSAVIDLSDRVDTPKACCDSMEFGETFEIQQSNHPNSLQPTRRDEHQCTYDTV